MIENSPATVWITDAFVGLEGRLVEDNVGSLASVERYVDGVLRTVAHELKLDSLHYTVRQGSRNRLFEVIVLIDGKECSWFLSSGWNVVRP